MIYVGDVPVLLIPWTLPYAISYRVDNRSENMGVDTYSGPLGWFRVVCINRYIMHGKQQ